MPWRPRHRWHTRHGDTSRLAANPIPHKRAKVELSSTLALLDAYDVYRSYRMAHHLCGRCKGIEKGGL